MIAIFGVHLVFVRKWVKKHLVLKILVNLFANVVFLFHICEIILKKNKFLIIKILEGMKKLKKWDIEAMIKELQVLSNAEIELIMGGGLTNYCFFNCLEYISNAQGCGHDVAYYMFEYAKEYGTAELVNVTPEHAEAFFKKMFNTEGGVSQASQIMGVFNFNGSGNELHAVMLYDLDPETNEYSYYDPTTGTSGTISGSLMSGWMASNGC